VSTASINNNLRWYAVHTHPKQEERVVNNLKAWQVETFCPLIKVRSRARSSPVSRAIIKPLFNGYIFTRFCVSSMLHNISYTRGVRRVVSFGQTPTHIDDEIIRMFKDQMGEDGFVQIGDRLKAGEKVIVKEGHFKNLMGIFEREMSDKDRVMILLTTVSFQSHITLSRDSVVRAA
jgi:transcriptional antiterminator RfaH